MLRRIADALSRHDAREAVRAQIFRAGHAADSGGRAGNGGGREQSSLAMRRLAADDARLHRLMHRASMLQGMRAMHCAIIFVCGHVLSH